MTASDIYPLPALPEQVTAVWLGLVLGHKIESIELTRSILNATASKLFFTIKYQDDNSDEDRPTNVCLKGGFNPAMLANEQYRDLLIAAYTNEARFFSRVAPTLSHISLPKVWWAGNSDEQGILVMDDLQHAGFTFGNPQDDWSVEQTKAGVEQLAALHASSWGVSQADCPWITPTYEGIIIGLTLMWDDQILGADRPPCPDIIKGSRERTVAAIKKHFATKNPKFRSLIHGDPHSGNTFIDKTGKPSFLDWQTFEIGSPFHDLAYFVVGALSVKDRRAHEVAVIDHYFQALARFGGPALSTKDEEVMREYSKSTMSGIGWILTPYDLQVKERVVPMCERYNAAIVDHKAIELIESLPDPE
ncbi:putative aminoglycoside phosphotransferase protein [Fusarium austroafricanum]|uniref:Putative aminoglycoside phosphotransferase protein n=1 Tax=Fusarium austroafricanum TaxID=2364996 RepID=A0A8H4NI57_9HYPO|nr:putative aminoglycoside phosphotransferase protein [Fusarium austroafricanum]